MIPVTLELGGKSPNIFFDDVGDKDDDFFDKAMEGFVMFALNQGEVCTCPSRAIIQESSTTLHGTRLEAGQRHPAGQPARSDHHDRRAGFIEQMEKILDYIDIGRKEGAELLIGGERTCSRANAGGYYVQPTVFRGQTRCASSRRKSWDLSSP